MFVETVGFQHAVQVLNRCKTSQWNVLKRVEVNHDPDEKHDGFVTARIIMGTPLAAEC
jgi:hypothetical protein